MLVTVSGIVTDVRVVLFLNAPSPITVTVRSLIVSGIVTDAALPEYLVIVAVPSSFSSIVQTPSVPLFSFSPVACAIIGSRTSARQTNAALSHSFVFFI